MSRVGIFSGTFDPIHDGHILFAQTALEQMGLSKVFIMPESQPRRKSECSDITHRAAMIDKAITGMSQFQLWLSPEKSHSTAEMLAWFKGSHPDDDLILLMGADVFEYVQSWDDINHLIENCGFVVALRTEDDGEIVIPLADQIGAQVEFLPSPLSSVSSTKIRQAIADNQPAKGLNDDVADFIREHHLYGS